MKKIESRFKVFEKLKTNYKISVVSKRILINQNLYIYTKVWKVVFYF